MTNPFDELGPLDIDPEPAPTSITVGWHRIAWQMISHLCGPWRASEHELAKRYDEQIQRARSTPAAGDGLHHRLQ